MMEGNIENLKKWSKEGHRDVFGKTIIDIAQQREEVVVLTADLSDATRVTPFAELFPERFVNVGVAEQNMIGTAAGLALGGKIPFVTTFASFASLRVCEQIRNDLAYQNLSVKVVGIDTGVSTGYLGVTHYGWEDIAVLRGIPNMVILSPSDGLSVMKLVWAATAHNGPVYIRLSGGKPIPIVYGGDRVFEIGKSMTVRDGRDVALFATGLMVSQALDAARQLHVEGIEARVVDMYCIKPIDEMAILTAAEETGLIVAVEEHNKMGGLGSAISEVLAQRGNAPQLIRMALGDQFCTIASHQTLLKRYRLTAGGIYKTVMKHMKSGTQ
jgi:transketolase